MILGIESSCDDTSAAIIKGDKTLLSNVISSQVEFHTKYGGVVPEIASRKHQECIIPVIKEALFKADVTLDDINGIAVTQGPGLVGSLLVGINAAKSIAHSRKLPCSLCITSSQEEIMDFRVLVYRSDLVKFLYTTSLNIVLLGYIDK